MVIEFINEGELSEIKITDWFWKKRRTLNFLDKLIVDWHNISPQVYNGIKFEIMIIGKPRYILRIYKVICLELSKIK